MLLDLEGGNYNMLTSLRRIVLIVVLSGLMYGCRLEEEPLTIGKAIEGDYRVEYYDHINEKYIQIGTLNIENGGYVFTPQKGADTSYLVDRFYFINNPEGQYELTDGGLVNGDDIFEESEDLDIITMISFQGYDLSGSHISPTSRNFFIRYNAKAHSLYFHSIVSEFQMWGVSKIE